jgi:DNA primase
MEGKSMKLEEFVCHLASRAGSPSHIKYGWIDFDNQIVTFPLWTVTGQLIGYQQYNWNADKLRNNDSKGRYWTYRRKDILTAWGLEYVNLSSTEPLYLVEGIWDAISVLHTGRRCLAVLSNNPQQLKPWLSTLPCTTIALCDGDKAGEMLSRVCDKKIILPDGIDANGMTVYDLAEFLNKEETNVFKS